MDDVNSEHIIHVTIREKIATADKTLYVCGNSDFVVHFDCDAEWEAFETKTARFIADDNSYIDVVFQGTVCAVPVLSNTHRVRVGVFAGNLVTTTPAYITATKSILCGDGVPADPPEDVYNQIMEKMNTVGKEEFEKLHADISGLTEQTAALTEQDVALDTRTTALEKSFADMDDVVEAVAEQIAALERNDAAASEQLGELSEQMAVLAEKDQEIMETATALTQQIGEQIDALVAKDQALVAADEALDTRTKALEKRFADMDYGNGIVIEYFRHNIGTKERGEVVQSLTLSWKLDRTPVTLTLDGVDVENDGSELKTGLNITADNQGSFRWILEATDNRNKVVRQTSPGFTFLNCVYYGMAEDTGTIDDGFIQSLKTKTSPTSQKGRTITYTGDGTYMWYCLPVSLGKVTFTCDGFPSPFELKGNAIQFTNKLGYKEPYYVYRSENRNSKTLAMVVT